MILVNQIQSIHEPRSITIISVVQEYLLKHPGRQEQYADDVVQLYHARVPDPEARTLHFREDDTAARMKANWQKIFRQLNGTVKLIADIEEPLVLALPDKYRERLKVKLAQRYGLLAAPIPSNTMKANATSISKILNSTGKMIERLGRIIEDGVIDENDIPDAIAAIEQIDICMSNLTTWRLQLNEIIPEPSPPSQVVPIKKQDSA